MQEEESQLPYIIAILVPFIFTFFHFIKMYKTDSEWKSKNFHQNHKFSRDHLLEAYISLAAKIILLDRKNYREKIVYINQYFNRYFPDSIYNFSDSLSFSFQNPVNEKTVASWINNHIRSKSKKTQIIYFLCGICMVDGDIKSKELEMLQNTADSLHITPKEFQSILAMYRKNYEDSFEKPVSSKEKSKKLALDILGVSETASKDEIKKAYRKLVKLNHPDKHFNKSENQRKIARERFIQIQKAYDLLEELG